MKIGSIYVKARNLTAAVPYFEEAIKLNANYAPAYRELGALYSMAGRYDQSKQNYQKYLELTKGNIPAKISYVRSLYFAGEYDEVIKNIEEIFAVDQSKAYLNRLAAYSCFEKKNPDYDKALGYMEALFKKASPELIIKRDYLYLAKILLKKNQNYSNMVREYDRTKASLERERTRYSSTSTPAEKAKIKISLDTLTAKTARLERQKANADKDIDRAFVEYGKALSYDPEDKALLTEIANNYYIYKRYELAAKTWAKLIALGKNDIKDYMQLGKWYYTGEKYKTADSVFNVVLKMDPNYLDAYVYIARTASKMETDSKGGLAKSKFEKVIEKAISDTVNNAPVLIEAYNYLGYYYLQNDNYAKSREYYLDMLAIAPNDKETKIKAYTSLASLENDLSSGEKTLETKIPYVNKAIDWYNKILSFDPNNEAAKDAIQRYTTYRKQLEAGINPNELKGTVKSAAGQPIANASIRVKDTAAETYTNAAGAFKFEIPQASEALIITAKGFKTKEIPVTRPLKALNVVLEQ